MDKKKYDYYQENRFKLEEIIKRTVKIDQAEKEDFREDVIIFNSIESNSLLMRDKKIFTLSSLLKKFYQILEREKSIFYDYKYDLLISLTDMLRVFQILEKEYEITKNRREYMKLDKHISFFDEVIGKLEKNQRYYYIKIKLDKLKPLFFISRNIFIDFLKQYGMPFDYTPKELSNEKCDYLIIDFKLNTGIENFEKTVKEYVDDAIKEIKIQRIINLENMYNIKLYYKEKQKKLNIELTDGFNIFDNECCENIINYYILEKDEVRIPDVLFAYKFEGLKLAVFKHFNERESRVLILSDMKKENLEEIKKGLNYIIPDRDIKDILYRGECDFYGLQFLEFLKESYNIEYGKYQ